MQPGRAAVQRSSPKFKGPPTAAALVHLPAKLLNDGAVVVDVLLDHSAKLLGFAARPAVACLPAAALQLTTASFPPAKAGGPSDLQPCIVRLVCAH